MAINYLNSINLNQNELIKAQIENQPNDAAAGTGVEGQLYYDTTLDVLKVWAGGSWVEVGGGVISLTAGTYLTNSGTAADPIIDHDDTTRTDGTTTETLTYGGTFTAYTDVTTNATGHITDAEETTFTMPAAEAYTFNVTGDSGTDQTIDSGDTLDIAGGTNISTVVGATDTVTVNLDDSISLLGSLTVATTGDFTGQVTIPQVPVSDTDAASKHYVDQAVTGALSYQGAYNAATNTPDLDSSPSSAIKTGWTYTVTVDGLFFTEQVRVGDVLIANNDAPTTLAEWTTVQNNVDLADLTTVGIGNVNAGTGISVAYSSGTATVTNTDTNTSNTDTGTIAIGSLTGTVNHNFGTKNTIVQTIDSSGDTVYCDVSRANNSVTATISTAQTGAITILVQKIG